jgi:hypothetical protein
LTIRRPCPPSSLRNLKDGKQWKRISPCFEALFTLKCNDFILFQYLRIWIFLNPLSPLGVLGGNFREPSFEVFPLDAHKTLSIRIPEATRLSVV